MKRLLTTISAAVIATFIIAAPYKVAPVESFTSVEITVNDAEAKSKSRSYSKPKKTYKKPKTAKKKPCSVTQTCTKSGSKGKLNSDTLFKKGDKKGQKKAQEALKKKPTTTTKKKTPTIGSKKRPVMTATKRKATTNKRVSSLSSPKAKSTRLSTQRTRSGAMSRRTTAENRRLRSERNYWRSRSQYNRNMRYSSYNHYGWGYGYYPGYTYHYGWGGYGYGYTRGGLSVIDYMILYSIFGHNTTSSGTTVVNNTYIINGEESEVTAVPQGSHVTGFGDKRTLVVASEDGSEEKIEIPAGSIFTDTNDGMLITTPDGVAVLVPTGGEAYKAEDSYQVPEEAQAPIEYGEFGNESDDWHWYNPFSWF